MTAVSASALLELAREWADLADIERKSSISMAAMGLPIELSMDAIATSRRALELSVKLEELARKVGSDRD